MIDIVNLSISIGAHNLLSNLNFKILPNDFLLVFGPNGAGKTTLMKVLSGQMKNYSGHVLLDGREISSYPSRNIAKRIAFLPQEDHFTLPFRVIDVLMAGRYPYQTILSKYSHEDENLVLKTATEFALSDFLYRDIQTLSGGEKKKVLIASAFLQNVSLFLLDEPFNFLDPPSVISLLRILKKFALNGKTIIVVTHSIEYFFPLANKMLALKEGKISYWGDKIFSDHIFFEAYGISYKKMNDGAQEIIYLYE